MCANDSALKGPGLHQATGVWALKDKRMRKRDQEEVGGGNNVVMNTEEEEKERPKEEKELRAASVWHSQGSRAEAKQLPTDSLAGQGLQEFLIGRPGF